MLIFFLKKNLDAVWFLFKTKRSGSPDKTGIGVEVKFLETATKTLPNGASWPNIRLWIQGTEEFVYLKQLLFSSA